jgi:hypothetical protein
LPSSLTTVRPSPRYSLPDHLCRFGVRAARNIARGFSRQHRITDFTAIGSASRLNLHAPRICLWCGLHAYPRTTTAWDQLPSCVTPSLNYYPSRSQLAHPWSEDRRRLRWLVQGGSSWALLRGYGNINPLSIDYASRPRLRPRLTQGGLAWPWNPWSSGGRVSHPSFATHACILTRATSTARSLCRFTGSTTLPYPPTHLNQPDKPAAELLCECHSFGGVLEPRYIVGAGPLDQ